MGARLFYISVTLFFVAMNVLLWRTDITGRTEFDSRLSPKLVWEKALTAAGDSALEIRHKGAKIGTARWQPHIGETRSSNNSDVSLPEGMVEAVSGYQIDLDGNFALDDLARARFGLHLKLSTNHAWQEFGLRVNVRPYVFEVQASAADQLVRIRTTEGEGVREQRFTFAELQQPDKLLGQLSQPWLAGALLAFGVPLNPRAAEKMQLQMNWQARNDSITVRHAHIRGYRLQTKLLDRYPISIFLNPAGEILRIDLPGDLAFLNESLTNL